MKDSIQKVVHGYLLPLVSDKFEFSGSIYTPRKIVISPMIFRVTKCVEGCGACCKAYTMDWLPFEPRPDTDVQERTVYGKQFYSHLNTHGDTRCSFVNDKGWCTIHTTHCLSCDFELIRFKQYQKTNTVLIGCYPYGRAWAMMRVDGVRGGLCEFTEKDLSYKQEAIRKFTRLKQWADYLKIPTRIDDILHYLENARELRNHVLGETNGYDTGLRSFFSVDQ